MLSVQKTIMGSFFSVKRWKSYLDEYNHELRYRVNVVAAFKNQLFLLISDEGESIEIHFPTFHRHIIKKKTYSKGDLLNILKKTPKAQ